MLTGFILPCLYAFFASLGFGIFDNIRGNKLFFAGLCGGLGWFIYLAAERLPISDIECYFWATVAISLFAEFAARLQKVPATLYLVPALIPLVPGGGVYYSVEAAILGETERAASLGLHTLGIAGALAMGIITVTSLMRLYNVLAARRRLRRPASAPR